MKLRENADQVCQDSGSERLFLSEHPFLVRDPDPP